MLHIYYGLGKGKTSTLNGSAIRAKGANLKVGYFKFLKGRDSSEDEIISNTVDDFKKIQSIPKFVINMSDEEKFKAREEALVGLKYIEANANKFDLIVLDEIIDLQDKTVNFITAKTLASFIKGLSAKDILISGHSLPDELKEIADLITYFKPEKHYYDQGIKAKKGIEF